MYTMECGGCDVVYIGETGRQLKIRIAEHRKAREKEKEGESALADHLINYNHTIKKGSESFATPASPEPLCH